MPVPVRRIVPEVVQTSGMDCGPAALTCLLGGFGIRASYARLRDACQTDVDGTSIDALEDAAVLLGLDAQQVMLPLDHLLLAEAEALPAIVVTRKPDGLTHFVVVWRRHGRLLQVMDPAVGRRWVTAERFLEEVYVHEFAIPAEAFGVWVRSGALRGPLLRRLGRLGVGASAAEALVDEAAEASSWTTLGMLDAAVRRVEAEVRAGRLRRRAAAAEVTRLVTPGTAGRPGPTDPQGPDPDMAHPRGSDAPGPDAARPHGPDLEVADLGVIEPEGSGRVDERYWFAVPTPGQPASTTIRGAVLVRVLGRAEEPVALDTLPADLRPALTQTDPKPGRFLQATWAADAATRGRIRKYAQGASAVIAPPHGTATFPLDRLRGVGGRRLAAVGVGAVLAAVGVLTEAMLFRALLSADAEPARVVVAVVALTAVMGVLDGLLVTQVTRIGRRLETGLRAALLRRLPDLPDRYLRSRPLSDLAERAHRLHRLRELPVLTVDAVRVATQLLLLPMVIIMIDPRSGLPAVLAAVVGTAVGFLLIPAQAERDLRLRSHVGALARFYFDALVGLAAVRAHNGEPVIEGEHGRLLGQWAATVRALHRATVTAELVQAGLGLIFVTWLLAGASRRVDDPATFLLLAYWAVGLPMLGLQLGMLARRYPAFRSVTLRIIEPLATPVEQEQSQPAGGLVPAGEPPHGDGDGDSSGGGDGDGDGGAGRGGDDGGQAGVEVRFAGVTVVAGGQPILSTVDLVVPAGAHVAIVGRSGSGKSSLAGLLLGWHSPAEGQVLVDGVPLDPARLAWLRRGTAWVDPTVTLWNRSLADNLAYGVGLPLVPATIPPGVRCPATIPATIPVAVPPAVPGSSTPTGRDRHWNAGNAGRGLPWRRLRSSGVVSALTPAAPYERHGRSTNGARSTATNAIPTAVIDDADLAPVVDGLDAGLDEPLGESGGLLSGGEAQRVRLGRARMRRDVRLAVLDEPFRGLGREQRRTLLRRARTWWPGATLLFVTHDVTDTLDFDRVLVVDGGRVVEDDAPAVLAADAESRYKALLDAEEAVARLFDDPSWKQVHVVDGAVSVASGVAGAVGSR